MVKNVPLLIPFLLAIFLGELASAEFFFEAEGGYTFGTFSFTSNNINYSDSATSVPFGFRAAWLTKKSIFIGINVDHYFGGGLAENSGGSPGDISLFNRTTAGLEVGYLSPHGFLLFAGYDLMNNVGITPSSTDVTNYPTSLSGTSIHYGFGYNFKPHFGINIVMNTPTYSLQGMPSFSNVSDSNTSIFITIPYIRK